MPDGRLVLIRHGQSEWNKKNLFTGWTDVDLSPQGEKEALSAGRKLKKRLLVFDHAFSSALKRAIRTMEIILRKMNAPATPSTKAWQLNERHYGALQGQNRQDIIKKHGAAQTQKWRRGFTAAPPPLPQSPALKNSKLYKTLKRAPVGESLKDTQNRVLPFWKKEILPYIQNNKAVLIVAHGNSLRSLIKHLENIPDNQISSLEIKTGQALIYKLNADARVLSKEIVE